jgi:hypothetical protein
MIHQHSIHQEILISCDFLFCTSGGKNELIIIGRGRGNVFFFWFLIALASIFSRQINFYLHLIIL